MFQKNNITPSIKRARGCKKLQKFAKNCRKNTTVCKNLQKIAEKMHNFAQLLPYPLRI